VLPRRGRERSSPFSFLSSGAGCEEGRRRRGVIVRSGAGFNFFSQKEGGRGGEGPEDAVVSTTISQEKKKKRGGEGRKYERGGGPSATLLLRVSIPLPPGRRKEKTKRPAPRAPPSPYLLSP